MARAAPSGRARQTRSSTPFTRRQVLGGAVALSGGLALSACGGGDTGGGGQSAPPAQGITQAQIDERRPVEEEARDQFFGFAPDPACEPDDDEAEDDDVALDPDFVQACAAERAVRDELERSLARIHAEYCPDAPPLR